MNRQGFKFNKEQFRLPLKWDVGFVIIVQPVLVVTQPRETSSEVCKQKEKALPNSSVETTSHLAFDIGHLSSSHPNGIEVQLECNQRVL